LIDEVTLDAVENNWVFVKYDLNTGMISFMRDGKERINIYLTTMSVETTINHQKGRNQMYRKDLNYKQVVDLLRNPRKHTGKGYREK